MLKNIINLMVCGVMLVASYRAEAKKVGEKIKLVDNGKSNYVILLSPQSLDSVKSAAKELQDLFNKVCGVILPITYKVSGSHKYIVIGKQRFNKKYGISAENLSKDSFIICEKDGNVFLVGKDYKIQQSRPFTKWSAYMESDSVGSYFATMEFARRFLGVEWYMPGDKGIDWQPRRTITVQKNLTIREAPKFINRYIEEASFHYESTIKKLFASGRFHHNYYDAQINRECIQWGRRMLLGNTKLINFQHAWWMFMPPTKGTQYSAGKAYGKRHPEYYALENGHRQNFHRNGHYGAQLCLSNNGTIKTYADNIIAYAKKHGGTNFSLSQNDGGGDCECKNCQTLDGKDPITGGLIPSKRFIYFANSIAKLVAKKLPNIRLGMYAYNASLRPPAGAFKVEPNVYISDVYNYLPNLWYSGTAERNKLIGYMKQWRTYVSHATVTSYYSIYGNWGFPWDTTEVIGETMQVLAKFHSSDGLNIDNLRYFGNSPGVDGATLWVLAKLLWNPTQDFHKLRDAYYRGAFGAEAGQYIKEYFDTINQSAIKVMKEHPMNTETENSPLQCTLPEKIYAPIRQQCHKLIEQAVKAGTNSNKRIKWRIERVAQAWKFTELTLDSFLYAKMARTGAYVDIGLTLAQTWARAVQAGKLRRKMLNSPNAYYALAQGSADNCQHMRPLGIVEKIPDNISLDVAVPLVNKPVVIDGKLDDKIWQNIPETRNFLNNRNGKAMSIKTWAKIFRTTNAFVIGFYCAEPAMDKLRPNPVPNSIWVGDVVEVYLSQTGTRMDFVQFLANAISTKKAFIMRGDHGMDRSWHPQWQAKGFKGTNFWSLEMRIPFDAIGITTGNIKNKTIFVNFCRERYANGANELYAWSPTLGGFAQPEKFGRMAFNVAPVSLLKKRSNQVLVNLLPAITTNMRGWEGYRIAIPKQWKTTSKIIDVAKLIKKNKRGVAILVINNNKPPMAYSLHLRQPIKVQPGDKFLLKIIYKRNIINPKLDRNSLQSPSIRVTFDKQNRGKTRLWFDSNTSVRKIIDWHVDEYKIYIDPNSKVSKMWIKVSVFGENNSIKNIILTKRNL